MRFLKYLILIIYFISFKIVLSANIPIETVFSDITKDYKYYNELQELYNRQAIYPDSDGKFNAYSLLTKDEFVGITMEVSCKKCTKPNTISTILNEYQNKNLYYDLKTTNQFYYCANYAGDNKLIDSYIKGFKCDDLTYNKDKIPFCPNNYITLEEALSIILRNSNLFTINDNNAVIEQIKNNKIVTNLSTDVLPKNTDGTVNTYYGYLKKALEYSIVEYDNLGVKKEYKLLELKDGKIYPKKLITKEEFLKMAYILIKTNSCKTVFNNNLASKIEILDSSCSSYDGNCELSDFSSTNLTYDFKGTSTGVCNDGIDDLNGYIWKFYNKTTGTEVTKYGKFINDYTFLDEGIWQINLLSIDKCLNASEIYNTININGNSLNVTLNVNKIVGTKPLPISYYSIVGGGNGEYSYVWDFGNNEKTNGKNVDFVYNESGVYNALLTVTDSDGKIGTATILLKVSNDGNCELQDSDSDGINDCDDLCLLVYGKSINDGCPVISLCNNDCSCPAGKKCTVSTGSLCPIKGVCLDDEEYNIAEVNNLTNDCLEKYSSNKIYGNVVCNTCPCLNFIDYLSTIRTCDYIFPAITSTGNTDIYSVGTSYEVN